MNTMTKTTALFNQVTADSFLSKVSAILDNGAVAVMLSIGHRTGLLDTLAKTSPATSAEIAQAAHLDERYVREWLAVMVMGRIVDYDPTCRSYALPPEHAACLTRGAPLGNMAVYAQHVALMGSLQDKLLQRFESGEGMAYDEYPCFHQVMAEDSGQTVVAGLEDILRTLMPDMIARLDSGIEVLDAGCGAGQAIVAMAERFPASRFAGYDLCPDAVGMATSTASSVGVSNTVFRVRDLSQFDETSHFDLVTSFDAVHDTKDPQQLLDSIHRALRPAGVYLMQDIGGSAHLENNMDFPFAAFLYAMSCAHCTPVSLAQGGKGLGTMWGWETAEDMLNTAGFDSVERTTLPHDPMNVWFVSRKSA